METILETKNKVMKQKIQKMIDIIYFCYGEEQKEQQEALLKIMEIIQIKYEQSFEKIVNSKNINKSLKYKQLEAIVLQELNNIEMRIL